MKRKLLTQMRAQWRGNIWLLVEFLLICIVLWYVCVNLYGLYWAYSPSSGYDFNNVYVATLGNLPAEAPDYVKYSDEELPDANRRDLENIINRIRQHPAVELVGAGRNAVPYDYSYLGDILRMVDGADTLYYMGNMRTMDADVLRALRVQGVNGESTEQLIEQLENGKVLISNFDEALTGITDVDMNLPDRMAGRTVFLDNGNVEVAPVLVNDMRRNDFEPAWGGVIIVMPSADNFPASLVIRIRPGMDREFSEWIQNARLRAGNLYVSGSESLSHRRETAQQRFGIKIVKLSIIMAFMVILVFLGFLGTYWFRIQERVPEIAIRKAMGATNFRVGRRLWSEGYILMGISIAVFVPLVVWFIRSDNFSELFDSNTPQYWGYYGMAITVIILALMVFAGIYFPARRAMKINPAIALKEQ